MTRYLTAALALSAGLALAACGSTASHPAAGHTSAVGAPNPTAASPANASADPATVAGWEPKTPAALMAP